MRILFSLLDAGIGGGQRVASQIAERLVDEGDQVGLVVPYHGPVVQRFERLGAAVHHYDIRQIRRPGDARPLARALASYDLLYSHTGIGGQIVGDVAARRSRTPHLVHQHTFPQFSSRRTDASLQRMLFRVLLATRRFIAVAPHVRQELVRLGVRVSDVVTVPNGVEVRAIERRPTNPIPRVGLLGRFDPGKGMLAFVRARPFVTPDTRFIIGASSGPFGEYERAVRNIATSSDVAIETPGEEADAFLRSLDVVVIPSRYEGCPLTLLEAMALGRPVVATDIPGIRSVVGDEGALLVPPDDPQTLAGEIERLILDEPLREALGKQGRSIAADRYSLERSLGDVVRVIHS